MPDAKSVSSSSQNSISNRQKETELNPKIVRKSTGFYSKLQNMSAENDVELSGRSFGLNSPLETAQVSAKGSHINIFSKALPTSTLGTGRTSTPSNPTANINTANSFITF